MIIDVMQHDAQVGLGSIADWAAANDVELRVHRLDEGEDIRALNPADMDGLLVLGGFKSVNDDETWLAAERIIIRSLDKLGRPVFGICLGAQQIVRAFGAPVFKKDRDFGFGQVADIAAGTQFTAMNWHSDYMSELPGATQLYTSTKTPNQGFKYHAHIMGLQFHLEVTPVMVQDWAELAQASVDDSNVDYVAMHSRLAELLTATFL